MPIATPFYITEHRRFRWMKSASYWSGAIDNQMRWQDRISVDPKVLVGKPAIKGTRMAVEFLVELLAEGWTHEQILKSYPHLSVDDIQAALRYASNGNVPTDCR